MLKLKGTNIYLSVLEREHCQSLWDDFEYDFMKRTEMLNIGHSKVKADGWFDAIQRDQGEKHIRLGIFTLDGEGVGDIALQDLEWQNRACTIGIGISKLSNRMKGYSHEALELLLGYAFHHLGLEKISATTLYKSR